jgi:hypothetical protein
MSHTVVQQTGLMNQLAIQQVYESPYGPTG